MIQRIQTIYLLMAGIVSAICIYLCVKQGVMPGWVMCSGITLITIGNIFSFTNRKKQMRICYVTALFSLAATVFCYWIALTLPFLALAWYSIRKDEKLVRSIDRIR